VSRRHAPSIPRSHLLIIPAKRAGTNPLRKELEDYGLSLVLGGGLIGGQVRFPETQHILNYTFHFISVLPYTSCRLALLHHHLFRRSPLETSRYPLHKRPDGAQVTLMPEEERLLAALTPKVDGVGQSVDSLLVAADERAAEIDAF
jgi:hypothetical protein